MKEYFINLDEFKNPTMPETAYILGLMWADGHICESNHSCSTTCIATDLKDVECVFDKLGAWGKYYRTPNSKDGSIRKPQMTISVCNKELFGFLKDNDYGAKSQVSAFKILKLIPSKLHRYWWLGFADGDGCFYSKLNYQFFFTGPLEQSWKFAENLCELLKLRYKIVTRITDNGSYSRFMIQSKAGIIKFGNYIYDGYLTNGIGFSRKRQRFLDFLITKPFKARGIGVNLHKPTNTWCARIKHNKQNIYLGYYPTKEEAAAVSRKKRLELGYVFS